MTIFATDTRRAVQGLPSKGIEESDIVFNVAAMLRLIHIHHYNNHPNPELAAAAVDLTLLCLNPVKWKMDSNLPGPNIEIIICDHD